MPSPGAAPAPAETITVSETTVACDGGGGALGHPRVFLTLVDGRVVCPYCSRVFVLAAEGAKAVG
ncbi:zinc-finger domain-containing protein [Elioraea tepida]|jgi:uncharacterized Zn-finger protein|uniref:Zinc-finger domain-containing protein n=1 Tax=Elioraea tepida TaxID=2843330 RepID=A0A975U5Q0_9PROT|nr:zinc-finger domain-containing protein [Elioraea tepida]QXM25908.1 zinc-finger domain-containing protein [Elioraea tepida]